MTNPASYATAVLGRQLRARAGGGRRAAAELGEDLFLRCEPVLHVEAVLASAAYIPLVGPESDRLLGHTLILDFVRRHWLSPLQDDGFNASTVPTATADRVHILK